jgi:circadian clock protein KaiB
VKKKTIARKKPAQRPAIAKRSATAKEKPASSPGASEEFFTMRLYVAGQSTRSNAAIANLRRICDEHIPGRYEVQIIDLLRHPELAKDDQIVAIPTLIKKMPVPVRRIIGDLSVTERVVVSLELRDN